MPFTKELWKKKRKQIIRNMKKHHWTKRPDAYLIKEKRNTLQWRKKLSKKRKGKTFEMIFGINKARLIKDKLSKAKIGIKRPKEVGEKISKSNKGRTLTKQQRINISKAKKGIPSGRKGKTYEEIYGFKIALQQKQIRSIKMTGRKFSFSHRKKISNYQKTHPEAQINFKINLKRKGKKNKGYMSYQQQLLFDRIKKYYKNSIPDFPVKTSIGWRYIDIAIINKKIGIEYNGSYWHTNKQHDIKRKIALEKEGWKILFFTKDINDLSDKQILQRIRNG